MCLLVVVVCYLSYAANAQTFNMFVVSYCDDVCGHFSFFLNREVLTSCV
jgi:hypothetical protein